MIKEDWQPQETSVQNPGITVDNIRKWCHTCNKEITIMHAANHPCLKSSSESEKYHPVKCYKCPELFPNMKQLANHLRKHKIDDAKKNISDSNVNTSTSTHLNNDSSKKVPTRSPSIYIETQDADDELGISRSPQELLSEDILPEDEYNAIVEVFEEVDNELPPPEDSRNLNADPETEGPSDTFVDSFKKILDEYDPNQWDNFISTLDEFVAKAKEHVGIGEDINHNRPPPVNYPNDPVFIQRLYRRNRRSAVHKILFDSSSHCRLAHSSLIEKYFNVPTKVPDLSVYNNCETAPVPPNTAPFTTEEVLRKLSGSERTTPGPDRLTYNHLRSFDQEARALTTIYNICLKAGKIPDSWKMSRTIFIPKGGDPDNLSNWHPISLSSTIYKLFSCLIAKRLSEWIEDYNVISNRQKGYRLFDGTLENNFLLEQKMKYARRKKKEVFVMLIDMKNAFGSIP